MIIRFSIIFMFLTAFLSATEAESNKNKESNTKKREIKFTEYDQDSTSITDSPKKPASNIKSRQIQLANNEPVYLLPAYYSFSSPYSNKLQPVEMKFQVSFRVIFLQDRLCQHCEFDFSYTQTQWLQIYNKQDSSPMRDINFNPQINFNYIKPIPFLGGHITWLRIGYFHLSNGERKNYQEVGYQDSRNEGLTIDSPNWLTRSKSVDRIFVQGDWQKGNFEASIRLWWQSPKVISDDGDNVDLVDYVGYGDLKLSYKYRRNLFEMLVTNVFNNYFKASYWTHFKGRVELGHTFLLTKRIGLYTQYIYGKGDSLYEYNFHVNRLGIGIRLNF